MQSGQLINAMISLTSLLFVSTCRFGHRHGSQKMMAIMLIIGEHENDVGCDGDDDAPTI